MTDPDARPLKVLVVCDGPDLDRALSEDLHYGLTAAGYEVVGVVAASIEVVDSVARLAPDVIIIDSESDWRDALEHVCVATQSAPRPIVLFTENSNTADARQAIAAGVSAYVVAGLAVDRVKPVLEVALARFEIEQSMRAELVQTREKLVERKSIDRAKGLLMQRLGLSEDEAYRKLRRLAMDQKESLGAAANRVIEAARLLS